MRVLPRFGARRNPNTCLGQGLTILIPVPAKSAAWRVTNTTAWARAVGGNQSIGDRGDYAAIAATARIHVLVLVTRNVADFAGTGIEIVNPWPG